MKRIPLSKGYMALVDDEDFDDLARFTWNALTRKSDDLVYATSRLGRVGVVPLYMHRYLLQVDGRSVYVDHINGDGLDNRRCNLRIATNSQNQANNRPQSRPMASRFKGVSWHGRDRLWRASIKVNQKVIGLGYFKVEEDAARAYDAAAVRYFGEFARPNFGGTWGRARAIERIADQEYDRDDDPAFQPGILR